MPHDIKGNVLKVGDEVVLRGKITAIQPGEEYCNCTLEVPPMYPRTEPESMSAVNTRQLEKIEPEPDALQLGAAARRAGIA